MNEAERYQKTLDAIRWLAEIAQQDGWKIPKGRWDLRCYEIMKNRGFRKTIIKTLKDNPNE